MQLPTLRPGSSASSHQPPVLPRLPLGERDGLSTNLTRRHCPVPLFESQQRRVCPVHGGGVDQQGPLPRRNCIPCVTRWCLVLPEGHIRGSTRGKVGQTPPSMDHWDSRRPSTVDERGHRVVVTASGITALAFPLLRPRTTRGRSETRSGRRGDRPGNLSPVGSAAIETDGASRAAQLIPACCD